MHQVINPFGHIRTAVEGTSAVLFCVSNAKKNWKSDHPDQNIKFWKDQYLKGKIEELPWENYQYKQNDEQNDTSLWQRIRKNNE